jgi:hypothetical protein
MCAVIELTAKQERKKENVKKKGKESRKEEMFFS